MDKGYRQKCFDSVFLSHKWGDSTNSGVNYKRRYSKTKLQNGLIKVDSKGNEVK
ncbi:MAG: hypothetical protein GOVbin2917_4 [Prokaryotic dsDNA virus sp.]|nr:MAG: hypothetical protein GOVbin2917_4 [Prokaryotic dsDNA virus sp.]